MVLTCPKPPMRTFLCRSERGQLSTRLLPGISSALAAGVAAERKAGAASASYCQTARAARRRQEEARLRVSTARRLVLAS